MKNQRAFKSLFSGLCETFGREVSDSFSRIYWAVLSRYDDAEVDAAIGRGLRKWKFFPKPAEIVEEIDGSPETRAWSAWEIFLEAKMRVGPQRSVLFDDPVIPAVIELMGGWREEGVFSWLEKDYPFRRNEFVKAYQAKSGDAFASPRALIGWADADNSAKGYRDWVRPPVRIGMRGGEILIDGAPIFRPAIGPPTVAFIEDGGPGDDVPVAEVMAEVDGILGGAPAMQQQNRG